MSLWTRFFLWRWCSPGSQPVCYNWTNAQHAQHRWLLFKINLRFDIEHRRFPIGFLRRYAFFDGFFYSPLYLWKILRKYGWNSGHWRYCWLWRALSWPTLVIVALILLIGL